jgi:hypothetical protein
MAFRYRKGKENVESPVWKLRAYQNKEGILAGRWSTLHVVSESRLDEESIYAESRPGECFRY